MKRRALITLLASAPAAWPLLTLAQQTNKVFRIGWLSASPALRGNPVFAGLEQGMRDITGMFFMQSLLMGKRMGLLKKALPQLSRVVALHDGYTADQVQPTAAAARSLGLELQSVELENPPYDFDQAMRAALQKQAQALVVLSSPVFFDQRVQVAEATARHRLPAIFHFGYYAKAGGLMAYGVNLPDMFRYAAVTHVDKILKGANPADLPVEQPTQFEFVVNLRTATAFGLTLPPSILLQASEVIE